ncbi:CHAT domain-containing protein [Variovorax sp. dw_954]|uniref:CHAT domain-containing protein n=1 Tax=Variovorax sp. dw_954 TaxID=2720078 RepID=UPI001BD20FF2
MRVFISYRRADSGGWVRALDTRMAEALGRENVFCDIKSIAPGVDFERELKSRLMRCDVALVVVGQLWASIRGGGRARRILEPDDLVRQEVELALKHGLTVVPVTVGDATLPSAEQLPSRLRRMLRNNAYELSVKHFDADIDGLIVALQQMPRRVASPSAAGPAAPQAEGKPNASQGETAATEVADTEVVPIEDEPSSDGQAPPLSAASNTLLAALRSRMDERPVGASTVVRLRITRQGDQWSIVAENAASSSATAMGQEQVSIGHSALELALKELRYRFAWQDLLEAGQVLYRLLIPRSLRPLIDSATHLQVVADGEADLVPWEMLKSPARPMPLGFQALLSRDCPGIPARRPAKRLRPQASALVMLGGTAGPLLPDLPGARAEVAKVADALEGAGFTVDRLVEPAPSDALRVLALGDHRVLHLGGHSVSNWLPDTPGAATADAAERRPLSGLVIGERTVLTAHELLLSDEPPELVTLGTDRIAHWAPVLRAGGSEAVIAAHEPVDDNGALLFFSAFYRHLCAGAGAFAAAMKARYETALVGTDSAIAASLYLRFYGDHDYRLAAVQAKAVVASAEPAK